LTAPEAVIFSDTLLSRLGLSSAAKDDSRLAGLAGSASASALAEFGLSGSADPIAWPMSNMRPSMGSVCPAVAAAAPSVRRK
jgi:hypothetical protein